VVPGGLRMTSIHVFHRFYFIFIISFPVDAIARTESGTDLLVGRGHVQCHYDHYNSHLLI